MIKDAGAEPAMFPDYVQEISFPVVKGVVRKF
jgi:hypothetical protein